MSPTPTPTPDLTLSTSTLGSPGFIGFVVTFFLAVALILLLRSLVTQLRRVDRRAAQDDEARAGSADDEVSAGGVGTGDAGAGAPGAGR